MQFMLFMLVLLAVTQFHREEHLRFVAEMKRLQKKLAAQRPSETKIAEQLKEEDWFIVGLERRMLSLRRAFNVPHVWDIIRYSAPMLLFCAMIFVLKEWPMACAYAAIITVKWFLTVTVLDLGTHEPRYDVKLFGLKLFGERLQEK